MVTLIVAMILSACSEPADVVVEERETPVAVAKAFTGSLSGSNQLTGTTKASSDIQVMPKTVGELKEVHVAVGDTVAKGQVIATVDDHDQRIAVEADQATLRQAQNGLERAKNGQATVQSNYEQALTSLKQAELSMNEAKENRTNNINNLKFEVESVERQWNDAKRNLERMKTLYEEGLISKQQYEEAQAGEDRLRVAYNQLKLSQDQANSELALKTLETTVEQAKINVDIANSSIKDTDITVKDAEVAVQQATLAVEASTKRLEDTKIKAPASGTIAAIEAEVGEMVSNQSVFARVVSVDMIDVEITVTAEQLLLFERDDKVEVAISGLTDAYDGTVTTISPTADQSGLFKVEVRINNEEGKIKPGMVATIVVEEVLTDESVIIPTAAVLERLDTTFVYVVVDGVAYYKEVEVIRYDTEFTAIVGDISPDDLIVVKGQNLITDEDKVRIVEEGN